jgi:hypothetical protein
VFSFGITPLSYDSYFLFLGLFSVSSGITPHYPV